MYVHILCWSSIRDSSRFHCISVQYGCVVPPGRWSLPAPHLCLPLLPSLSLPNRYVHILIKGAPEMANNFAHQHSLPKLAQSLKPYWSRSPSPTPDEEAEWEECVSSLLEVTSSIALMTDEGDIWTVLDRDPFGEVAQVRIVFVMPCSHEESCSSLLL